MNKCKIANFCGKHILVGAPSSEGILDGCAILAVFVLLFGGSLYTQKESS
jgi:hypothetical protein